MMRLRATFIIDLDAADYVDAANHQQKVEAILAEIAQTYPTSRLELRERREARMTPQQASATHALRPSTGNLHAYVD